MALDEISFPQILGRVGAENPLVQQLTNFVSAQVQADIVAILGGLSIMSGLTAETIEITMKSDALLINTGTPTADSQRLFRTALYTARQRDLPIVLDVVGYGFTQYRRGLVDALLGEFQFSVIKGNCAEISALAGALTQPKGVSSRGDFADMTAVVEKTAKKYKCVVFSTGTVDTLSDGVTTLRLGGGSQLAATLSGIGCALGSCAALFSAITSPLTASAAAISAFRFAAAAAERAKASGSFYSDFKDELYLLRKNNLDWRDLIV